MITKTYQDGINMMMLMMMMIGCLIQTMYVDLWIISSNSQTDVNIYRFMCAAVLYCSKLVHVAAGVSRECCKLKVEGISNTLFFMVPL